MRKIVRIGFVFIFGVTACQSDQTKNQDASVYENIAKHVEIPDTNRFGEPVFSNMYLNVKLAEFFQKGDENFHSEWLHDISSQNRYITTATKALKLGIYAIDFNYTRMYGQFQESEHYLRTVVDYASSLGIPDEFSREVAQKIEKSIADADSFERIANELYNETVRFLKMNENEYAIALVVIGGWTEAMYLSANMMETNGYTDDYLRLFLKQVDSLKEIIKITSQFTEYEEVKDMHAQLTTLYKQMLITQNTYNDDSNFQPLLEKTLADIMSMRQYLIKIA